MNVMSEQQALDFAESSAIAAIDYLGEMPDSVASYRDNIRDTLNGHYASEHEAAAFEAYDKKVEEMLGNEPPKRYCPVCGGQGYLETAPGPCPVCRGEGKVTA